MNFARQFAAASVLALACASPSFAAVEAEKVSQAVTALLSGYGAVIKAASAEMQGSDVVLKGLVIVPPNGEPEQVIGDVTLANVSEADGGYLIGEIAAPAKAYPVKDGTWNFGGASVKNIMLPAPETTDPVKSLALFESVSVEPSTFVTSGGVELVNFKGMNTTYTRESDQLLTFNLSAPELTVNFAAVPNPDPQMMPTLTELGLATMQMAINARGSWNMADGRMTISEESFDIKNAGKLNFAMDISGYTPQLASVLRNMAKEAKGAPDSEMGAKLMGVAGQITLNGISLRYDDVSLFSKAMDVAAKRMGQPKEALIAQGKGMAPMMFMQLQDPEFSTAATAAISAFLDDPKSLEIKIAPSAPIPVSQLVASGMAAPATLIKQLGLQVLANH